jgi:hypothetical protein
MTINAIESVLNTKWILPEWATNRRPEDTAQIVWFRIAICLPRLFTLQRLNIHIHASYLNWTCILDIVDIAFLRSSIERLNTTDAIPSTSEHDHVMPHRHVMSLRTDLQLIDLKMEDNVLKENPCTTVM